MCLFKKNVCLFFRLKNASIIPPQELYLFEHADQDFGTKVTLGWFGISVNHKGVGNFQPGRHLDIDPRRSAWKQKWLCDLSQPSDADTAVVFLYTWHHGYRALSFGCTRADASISWRGNNQEASIDTGRTAIVVAAAGPDTGTVKEIHLYWMRLRLLM